MKRSLTSAITISLAAVLIYAVPAADAATSADAPWSGYKVTTTSQASGGWIGGRRASGKVVYRIDPTRPKTTTSGFKTPSWQSLTRGTGSRAPSAVDTARAAWIVGKYGGYKYAVQNAAVEVALNHLIHGGAWAFSGTATKKRLAQTGQSKAIRSFATTMLKDSARLAGPYVISLSATKATIGGKVTVTVGVKSSRTGAGIASLPVSVTYAGNVLNAGQTRADGRTSVTVPAGAAGPRPASVSVDRIPETRLLVSSPTTSGASRVVVAGLKAQRTVAATVPVRAVPALMSSSTSAAIATTQRPTGTLRLSNGYPSSRTGTASLYGPFDSATSATCDPARLTTSASISLRADGTYALPELTISRAGHYIWGATVPEDAFNLGASTCSGTVLARVTPRISATPTGTSYRAGAYLHGRVTTSGVPSGSVLTSTLRLYGPFSAASAVTCDPAKLKATQQVIVRGDGTMDGPDLSVTKLGYYVWVADLPAGPASTASSSSCTAPAAQFRVIW